jgi:hypothetical protein
MNTNNELTVVLSLFNWQNDVFDLTIAMVRAGIQRFCKKAFARLKHFLAVLPSF